MEFPGQPLPQTCVFNGPSCEQNETSVDFDLSMISNRKEYSLHVAFDRVDNYVQLSMCDDTSRENMTDSHADFAIMGADKYSPHKKSGNINLTSFDNEENSISWDSGLTHSNGSSSNGSLNDQIPQSTCTKRKSNMCPDGQVKICIMDDECYLNNNFCTTDGYQDKYSCTSDGYQDNNSCSPASSFESYSSSLSCSFEAPSLNFDSVNSNFPIPPQIHNPWYPDFIYVFDSPISPQQESVDSDDDTLESDFSYAGPRDNIKVVSAPGDDVVYEINWSGVPVYSVFPPFPLVGMTSTASRIRLAQVEGDRLVNRLKNTNLDKFHTLCKMHLSFLLHLPGSSLDEFLSDGGATWGSGGITPSSEKPKFRHFGKKKSNKENKVPEQLPITHETIDQILPLIDYLNNECNLKQEGLFRKSGHIGRQKLLREKLQNGEDVRMELESGIYSAHDCASVLKAFLSDLQEPVLTEKHYLAHCQIPEMDQEDKQLQTLQLLLQLMPSENLFLLRCLLTLLQKVAQECENKMTSETLGTLFAPHLLVPRKMSPNELQAIAGDLTKTVAFMIDNAEELFKLPQPLIRDIATYWAQMETSSAESTDDHIDQVRLRYRTHANDGPIHTSITFADRQASQQAAAKTDTQIALAQLYAHVSSMPESAKKRRLLKQFNKANSVTMGMSPAPSSEKHKRTKSFGDSIKKIVSRNHRRRGSSHSLQIQQELQSQDNTPFSVNIGKYTSQSSQLLEHTPVIKRSLASTCNTPMTTPVMKLFSHDLHNSILPSSPRVHIVDMKENQDPTAPLLSTRKRKSPPIDCPMPGSPSFNAIHATQNGLIAKPIVDLENMENIPIDFSLRKKFQRRGLKSPIKGTPGRCFERPVAFISPITRTINKASLTIQTNMMTPGSRAPMAVLQTP